MVNFLSSAYTTGKCGSELWGIIVHQIKQVLRRHFVVNNWTSIEAQLFRDWQSQNHALRGDRPRVLLMRHFSQFVEICLEPYSHVKRGFENLFSLLYGRNIREVLTLTTVHFWNCLWYFKIIWLHKLCRSAATEFKHKKLVVTSSFNKIGVNKATLFFKAKK